MWDWGKERCPSFSISPLTRRQNPLRSLLDGSPRLGPLLHLSRTLVTRNVASRSAITGSILLCVEPTFHDFQVIPSLRWGRCPSRSSPRPAPVPSAGVASFTKAFPRCQGTPLPLLLSLSPSLEQSPVHRISDFDLSRRLVRLHRTKTERIRVSSS